MTNNRIKILATFSLITLIGTILTFAPNFSANAENDEFVKEIAEYKTWKKLNENPIKVEISLDFSGG